MEKPVVAEKSPIKVSLEKNKKYFFCSCGRSSGQPFCDGSHKGTGLNPNVFEVAEDCEKFLCRCKQTKNAPYCDGTHKEL